jgi:hypothetical protein
MADQNKLAPTSMNMLRFLMMNNGMGQDPTSAKEMLAQQEYYRSVLGDNMPQNSRGPMPFFSLGQGRISDNPAINLELMSPRAQYVEGMGFQTPPPSFGGRIGTEGDLGDGQFRAGVQTMAVQFPDGTVRMMPRNFDLGYKMPLMGGTLNVGGNVMPKDSGLPQTQFGANVNYSKKF